MKIFYVDFENANNNCLNGIAKLDDTDVVRIYYNNDTNTITFGTHRLITDSPAKIEYVKISQDLQSVNNALAVILMKELSERIIKERRADFYIVSEDGEFDNYIQEKKKTNISICKVAEVRNALEPSASIQSTPVQTTNKEEVIKKFNKLTHQYNFKKYMSDYADYEEEILSAYMNANSRQEFIDNLKLYFYNDAVNEILERMPNKFKDIPE